MHPSSLVTRHQNVRDFTVHGGRNRRGGAIRAGSQVASRRNSPSEDVIVKLAQFILANPFLNQLGVAAAQSVMKKTAANKGINWTQHVQELKSQQALLDSLKARVENESLSYPPYYLVPIHAYAEGNLSWEHAFDTAPARGVVAARTFTDMNGEQAVGVWETNMLQSIKGYRAAHQLSPAVGSILDMGCGIGKSTVMLASAFPEASITGLDLSPHFLSVAALQQQQGVAAGEPWHKITYVHAVAEESGLPASSYDMVSIQFVFHECPASATKSIIQEAHRLLKPGGQLAIIDSDPNSETLQKLHPAIMLLREQTEPWMDEFRHLDMVGCLQDAGFVDVEREGVSSRHMSVLGTKAAA